MHHPQFISPTERWVYNLIPIKPRKRPVLDNYAHSQIVHYMMTHYFLRKGLKKLKKFGKESAENEPNQLHMNSTFNPMNVANLS